MNVREWTETKHAKQADAADALGVPLTTLRSWIYEAKTPSLTTLRRVERVTGGDVTVYDWPVPLRAAAS